MSPRKFVLFTLTITATIVLTTCAFTQSHSYGALKEDALPSWIKPAPSLVPQDGWDEYCDLSPNFPPVGNQGGQGSCTCWAVGYYFKTYLVENTDTDSAFFDFKLCFYDESGNYTEAIWEPLFNTTVWPCESPASAITSTPS